MPKVIDRFNCPDCKQEVTVSESEETKEQWLLHPLPVCSTFIDTSESVYKKLVQRSKTQS